MYCFIDMMCGAKTWLKKLEHKFVKRAHRGRRLKFEPLNLPTPPATPITRSLLITNKGSPAPLRSNRRGPRPENTRSAQNITPSIPNQNKSNLLKSQTNKRSQLPANPDELPKLASGGLPCGNYVIPGQGLFADNFSLPLDFYSWELTAKIR